MLNFNLTAYFNTDGPGAVVLAGSDGQITNQESFGLADTELQLPLHPDFAFDIASVGKIFTATLILSLAQQKTVHLNQSISEWLPELSEQKNPHSRETLIRDLLYHTSGFDDYLDLFPASAWPNLEHADIIEAISKRDRVKPGSLCGYSNTNYVLLAEIAVRATGKPFFEMMKEEVFQKAEMENTGFINDGMPGKIAKGYENFGWANPEFERQYLKINVIGDGGIYASARDVFRFMHALFSGKIIPPETLQFLKKPGKLDTGSKIPFSAGFVIEKAEKQTWLCSSGAWPGYASWLVYSPESRQCIICFSNQSGAPVQAIVQKMVMKLN